MDEDASELDKPRFLLPEGCKDLNDLLRLQEQQAEKSGLLGSSVFPASTDLPPEMPTAVTLPDPITVRDLASALRLKPYKVILSLIYLKIFASLDTPIDFITASAVCSQYGVVATKLA